MNKNLLIVGAVAVAGFTLTAFYGPTKADQMADIAIKVTAGLDALRADEKAKCDAKVAEAVAAKVAEMSAMPEPTPAVVATPAKGTKKSTAKGPKAPTVPTPTPPTKPVETKKREGSVQEGANEPKKRDGAAPEGKQEPKKRGGAVKVEGGGGK
jgi:outer membrane biosynthesis protein TonB